MAGLAAGATSQGDEQRHAQLPCTGMEQREKPWHASTLDTHWELSGIFRLRVGQARRTSVGETLPPWGV